MKLLLSGATTTMEELLGGECRPYLGALLTPQSGNSLERVCRWQIPYAIDNAAFDHRRFDAGRFLKLCRRAQAAAVPPLFVTVPDQVGRHDCTLYLFDAWMRAFAREGLRLPWAFVLQNGVEGTGDVPWDQITAVFIGGDDDFKEDTFVLHDLVPEARRRGKWVPRGRVNGRRRLRLALHGDVDSVDGSSLARFSRTWIP